MQHLGHPYNTYRVYPLYDILYMHDSRITFNKLAWGLFHVINTLFLSQMMLFCKDPNGEGIDATLSNPHQSRDANPIPNTQTLAELEGKVASLEGKLKERDDTINKMKIEIEAARKVIHKIYNHNY